MNVLKRNWQRLQTAFSAPPPPAPGLYTYRLTPEGGQRRLHLRIEGDGAGALFVNVNDVIHLNATAAEIVKLALDGVSPEQARAALWQRYAGVAKEQLAREIMPLYALVERLRAPEPGCPVCAIAEQVSFKPLFSTLVNAPFKVDVALTYACNNACAHCYNAADRLAMSSLTREQWFEVLDKLHAIGAPHLILTGGEPTLHPDLHELIRYADAKGFIVGMNSNGRALARPGLAKQLAAAGLNHIQITLESCHADMHDAMTAAPGAFAQTIAGIRNALDAGLHTITNTTLTRRNQGHALALVDFVYALGLRTFAMNSMIYAGGGVSAPDAIPAGELAPLLASVRDHAEALGMRFLWYTVTDYCQFSPLELGLAPKRCNAAEYSLCIEPNGDVLPCQSYYVAAGNILRDPWDAIWNSALFRSFRNREEDPGAAGLPAACWDCPDLELCGGGCRLEREKLVNAPERGCGRSRAL